LKGRAGISAAKKFARHQNLNAVRGLGSQARELDEESKSAHLTQLTGLVSSARKLA